MGLLDAWTPMIAYGWLAYGIQCMPSQQLSPVSGCAGIELLQADTFDLHCFQSLTGPVLCCGWVLKFKERKFSNMKSEAIDDYRKHSFMCLGILPDSRT
ncbi:hypothetical protein KIW84_070385 [Lathyrus oleraceus]|uniref:Uncharacterized protein n=1 Tax=Pisum sativum TaxID=3888 RepID=A0A9D4VHW1_PEA|nr:hypothetical protein KIW84_070385 [Pisum sativum]